MLNRKNFNGKNQMNKVNQMLLLVCQVCHLVYLLVYLVCLQMMECYHQHRLLVCYHQSREEWTSLHQTQEQLHHCRWVCSHHHTFPCDHHDLLAWWECCHLHRSWEVENQDRGEHSSYLLMKT